ncbi:MAG TPA: hydroxylamine reductase [Peptococcaceae bacterium]|nr:MAG: Hydroxylamine reductase [Clostridia bacterium 41_269]HBT20701.1 hydroxylamine reductase [Peptococcaceae bacterium]
MFCYQCEETAKRQGCTVAGVCGKDQDTAVLQDLLIFQLKGIGLLAEEARKSGIDTKEVDTFVVDALFATLTNVNFDSQRIAEFIYEAQKVKENLLQKEVKAALDNPAVQWKPEGDMEALIAKGQEVGVQSEVFGPETEDTLALKELITYGLKGISAYAHHAQVLGYTDDDIYKFIEETLAATTRRKEVQELVELALKVGEYNLKTMELLDKAHNETFGSPEPTPLSLGVKKGPAILVSGHDLLDLYKLLEQTQDKGINIYTHSEMLPAHGYPGLKKFKHLVGNFGGAWQDQQKDFAQFPGAILMTTNCIQRPLNSYKDNIFTTGVVGWPGVKHIGPDKDFTPVIERALELGGFPEDREGKTILTGFGHKAVLSVADKVIEGVKSGRIRHFFLIGGCDGRKPERNYYTELAKIIPDDCVILTLACGKYRINNLDLGNIGDLPRLLDVGQCNDAYSAIKIAVALAEAFNCGVNDLPLSLVLSWYEQKAVAILLTLLHLGIKDMRLGPSLPAFVTPNVLKVLVDNFQLKPITTPQEDLKAILG